MVQGTPVAFIQVSDRERGLAYYTGILGLKLRSSDAFGDFLEAGPALIRLTALPDYQPHPHPVFGWNVADIAAAAKDLRAAASPSPSTRAWARTPTASGPRPTAPPRSPGSPTPMATF